MSRSIPAFAFACALAIAAVAAPVASARVSVDAACVRFSAVKFDAPGNDHYNLNGEWVRITNTCSTSKALGAWRIHDHGVKHTYRFPSGVSIGPGASITLYTGAGTNTTTRRYWRFGSAVWNNTGTEYAYLRNASGALQSRMG
jgi:uncharacterized membrane protein